MARTALKNHLGFPDLTEELLYYDKHSKRDNFFIDKFLVEVSNLLQPLVALPPPSGARPMPINGRVKVD